MNDAARLPVGKQHPRLTKGRTMLEIRKNAIILTEADLLALASILAGGDPKEAMTYLKESIYHKLSLSKLH